MAQSESETVLTEHHETDNLDPRTDAPARPGIPVHIAPVQLGNITVPTPVVLSPMAGVTNWPFRVICEEYGPDGLYVAEMITARALVAHNPKALRLCHFAKSEKIRSLQLYGVNPSITEQAAKIVVDGNMADHVDLNFGCPAKLVNQSKGGAVLLKEPETVYRIVKAVREAVPAHLPVSAKIRLGYDDKELYMDNAQAVFQGGANELAVHARTKREGYKAPAHWEYVDAIRRALPIPVTANGEIWNHADALTCARVSGCDALMVGRGAISLPNLANVMKTGCAHMSWAEVLQLMVTYTEQDLASDKADYYPSRIKQWFSYIVREYPQADELFRRIRTIKTAEEIRSALERECASQA